MCYYVTKGAVFGFIKGSHVDFTNHILMLNNDDVILLKEQLNRFDERINCA